MSKTVSLANYGTVQSGKVTRANHPNAKPVFNFFEIPFAQPPIGKLRFLPPKRALPWDGVLCNKEQQKIPVQIVNGVEEYYNFVAQKRVFYEHHCSEDCLYLNVFVPDIPNASKLPVMVWFYGGAFQLGPSMYNDGTALAGMHDVIVVSPNYRVNTFGFMSLGADSECKGNLGLFDQLQALKWVRETIESFGGDRDNVTIFGHSAGGISINMHMLSPLSQGYFNRAISLSGTALMSKIFVKDQGRASKKFLEILGITETNPKLILEQLQSLPTEKIYDANMALMMARYAWLPTMDGSFLPDSPMDLLSQGRFSKVPFMLGCTNSEGGYLMNSTVPEYTSGISKEQFYKHGRALLKWFNMGWRRFEAIDLEKAPAVLLKEYNKGIDPTDKLYYSRALAGIMSDALFTTGIIKSADVHAASGFPTYFYHMTIAARYNHDREYGPIKAEKPSYVKADHGDDVYLMWGLPFLPDSIVEGFRYSDDEKDLSGKMMTYITNFAKTGNPNKGESVELHWPTYSSNRRQHLVFDAPLSTTTDFGIDNYNLYTKILPKL